MHKAGGIIALIAGVLSIFALIFTVFFSAADAAFSGADNAAYNAGYALGGYLVGGFLAISVVIVLSIIILNTRTRWPGIVMAIVSILAIVLDWAGGFVSICLVFATVGALMSLNLGGKQTQTPYDVQYPSAGQR